MNSYEAGLLQNISYQLRTLIKTLKQIDERLEKLEAKERNCNNVRG